MGFYIEGYFIGFEARDFSNDEGSVSTKYSVNIATGNLAYRVYLADGVDVEKFQKMKPGDKLVMSVRVYVGRNGKIGIVDGTPV